MDMSANQYKSDTGRRRVFSSGLFRSAQELIRRLVGVLTLTEVDRLQVGIDLGGEGRDNGPS
jgi:hypothetical protein